MSDLSLPKMFHDVVSRFIDERGVYPHQLIYKKDGKTNVCALDLNGDQAFLKMREFFRSGVEELIYTIDRYCKEGQGTTLGDCLAGSYWNGVEWKPFVIEYQHKPRIVKEIDYNNEYWNQLVCRELTKLGLI